MKAVATVSGRFSASHLVAGHTKCGRLHGHDWQVEASISGQVDPRTGMVVDFGEVEEALSAVLSEFDGRHINDMLPGASPTHEGLAAYIRERIALKFPLVSTVSVITSGYRVEVEWLIR